MQFFLSDSLYIAHTCNFTISVFPVQQSCVLPRLECQTWTRACWTQILAQLNLCSCSKSSSSHCGNSYRSGRIFIEYLINLCVIISFDFELIQENIHIVIQEILSTTRHLFLNLNICYKKVGYGLGLYFSNKARQYNRKLLSVLQCFKFEVAVE